MFKTLQVISTHFTGLLLNLPIVALKINNF
jgi:hypothetical protein